VRGGLLRRGRSVLRGSRQRRCLGDPPVLASPRILGGCAARGPDQVAALLTHGPEAHWSRLELGPSS
jgi:hypothetical protein